MGVLVCTGMCLITGACDACMHATTTTSEITLFNLGALIICRRSHQYNNTSSTRARTHVHTHTHTHTQVTSKTFNFAAKNRLPFFFVSASDGTNVVKIFRTAILAGIKWKAAPKEDFYQEVCGRDWR